MKRVITYRHSRAESLETNCEKLYNTIESAVESAAYQRVLSVFSKILNLSQETLTHEAKAYLLLSFDFLRGRFTSKFSVKSIFSYAAKYLAFHIYVLLHSKKINGPPQKFEVLCDEVETKTEANRFLPLLDKFSSGAIITPVPIENYKHAVVHAPRLKNYNRKLLLETSWKTLLITPYLLLESIRQGVNLFAFFLYTLNRYFFYKTVFSRAIARFIIQERHYNTSALKNELFHKAGGELTSTLQKNIIQLGLPGYYYHVDRFYSLGTRTVDRALKLGANIQKIEPVGSYFMENYWFEDDKKNSDQELPLYDVVSLEGNIGDFLNTYDSYLEDYYEHFRWLAILADRHPNLKVGVKHHSNNIPDKRELEVLQGSRVIRITQSLPSYALSFKARCVSTWGSTMGYELIGHGKPCIFADPGRRNISLLPTDDLIEPWRAKTYDEFEALVFKLIKEGANSIPENKKKEICFESSAVSQKIVDDLRNGAKHGI